jgi:hypothetical protein
MRKKKPESSIATKLRDLKHAEPFSPFRIKLSGGETLTVTRADTFMVSPRGTRALLYPEEDPRLHEVVLDEVLSIELVQNGRRRHS